MLDVACGTAVLAWEAAKRIEPGGTVAGLDRNDGMLAVARRKAPAIDWHLGRAEALPFANESFDAVVSQFGLMFFEDRGAALNEIWSGQYPHASSNPPGDIRAADINERLERRSYWLTLDLL